MFVVEKRSIIRFFKQKKLTGEAVLCQLVKTLTNEHRRNQRIKNTHIPLVSPQNSFEHEIFGLKTKQEKIAPGISIFGVYKMLCFVIATLA